MRHWKRMQRVAALLGTALIASVIAQADIVAYRSIADLVPAADLIVVGQVAGVEPGLSDDSGFVSIVPIEYLKGSPAASPLRLGFEHIRQSRANSLTGRRVLAFAAKNPKSGLLRLVPMVDGANTSIEHHLLATKDVAPQPIIAKHDTDTPIQKVIKELATIQAHSDSSDALTYLMPLAWAGAEAEAVRAAFRALVQSPTKSGRTAGLAGLVALGDLEGMEALNAAVAQRPQESSSTFPLLERTFKTTDPRATAILARWLEQGRSPAMRAAAAGALARIHTAAAIAILGPRLDDPDFQVRWRAIGGLAMFANNVPIGGAGPADGEWPFRTDDTFRFSVYDEGIVSKNEEHYLDFWRRWWRENADAVARLAGE